MSEQKSEDAEALTRDTAERVRTGLTGYPADDIERGEREAIEAEGRGELCAPCLTAAYLAGLRTAAMLMPPSLQEASKAPTPDASRAQAAAP